MSLSRSDKFYYPTGSEKLTGEMTIYFSKLENGHRKLGPYIESLKNSGEIGFPNKFKPFSF